MGYRLEYTETLKNDLDCILDYIINELYAPQTASKLYRGVKSTFDKVVGSPEMYPLHPLKRLSDKGYHFCQAGNYLIFYTIDNERQIIYAQAMVYGGMDLINGSE